MIVTKSNIDKVEISEKEKRLLYSLLEDVDEFNKFIGIPEETERTMIFMEKLPRIWISWQDTHDEYSPENLEAPDYYGCFRICISPKDRFSDADDQYIPISSELTLNELDTNLCTLVNYFSELYDFEKFYYAKKKTESEKRYRLLVARQERAKEKYKNYIPAVGDICMMLTSYNEFYRLSCTVCPVIITEVNELAGPLMKTVRVGYVDSKSMLPTGSSSNIVFGVINNPNMVYSSASHNDAFAREMNDTNNKKRFHSHLFCKYQAIEIIDEWMDRYSSSKTNQYFWHSCKMKRVSPSGKPSIKDYLMNLKNVLENYKC